VQVNCDITKQVHGGTSLVGVGNEPLHCTKDVNPRLFGGAA
jgi:hypothetical protein